jgi:hypothetical protein
MRTVSKDRRHFHGTHLGYQIEIEKEPDGRFYIFAQNNQGVGYDGWAPDDVRTMPAAKREALYGLMLKKRPAGRPEGEG